MFILTSYRESLRQRGGEMICVRPHRPQVPGTTPQLRSHSNGNPDTLEGSLALLSPKHGRLVCLCEEAWSADGCLLL